MAESKGESNHSPDAANDEGSPPFVPGTVHLVDLERTMRAKHASGTQSDVVLVPAPSADPDDPLNWAPRRKLLSAICMCVYTLTVGISSASIYSVLIPIADSTGLTLNDLNSGTGYMFLLLGLGCLVWQPLALKYGKRPVYLFSCLATAAFNCWAPHARTQGTWIASRIIIGFVGAPIESLCEISVTDVYFTHERGTYIALYGLLLAGSNYFAPLISGFIADGQGWEWVLYWTAIFNAGGFVFLFFFMEETNYHRTSLIDREAEQFGDGNSPQHSEEEAKETSSRADIEENDASQHESNMTYLEKLKPITRKRFWKQGELLSMAWHPIVFLTFPVIFFAGFTYGSFLVWFNVLNGTTSLIFSSPPYNFKPSHVGLVYIAPLIGTLAATFYCGTFGDKFIVRMARKNNGVMEPEHRLWLQAVSIVIIPGGLILWGVGAAHEIHWFGVVFAMGIMSFGIMAGLQIPIAYMIDSYRSLSGEAMVTLILIRNCMSFAIGYGITPWVTNMGYQNAFIVAAVVSLVQVLTFLPVIYFGKRLRKASVPRYWYYINKISSSGGGVEH